MLSMRKAEVKARKAKERTKARAKEETTKESLRKAMASSPRASSTKAKESRKEAVKAMRKAVKAKLRHATIAANQDIGPKNAGHLEKFSRLMMSQPMLQSLRRPLRVSQLHPIQVKAAMFDV